MSRELYSVLPGPLPNYSANIFLKSLSAEDSELIKPHLRSITLGSGAQLLTAGERVPQVFFPDGCVISMIVNLEEGASVEAAILGRESVLGAGPAINGDISLSDVVVRVPGRASLIDGDRLRAAAELSASIRLALSRHERALLAQVLQSLGCFSRHSAESRLARWLLVVRDLTGDDTVAVTHESLGLTLGVRRNTVSVVAGALQRAGYIHYIRGRMTITDLNGLTNKSCGCYATVKDHRARLLRDP